MFIRTTKSSTFNCALARIVLLPRQFVSDFLSLFWGRCDEGYTRPASSRDRKIAASLRRAGRENAPHTTLRAGRYGPVIFCAGSSYVKTQRSRFFVAFVGKDSLLVPVFDPFRQGPPCSWPTVLSISEIQ